MPDEKPIIVRKRVTSGAGAHHSGGWKIAYADFMTAMMAFFLVMWLLSTATPRQREGIAEHFRMPLRVALEGGPKASLSSSVIPGGGADPARNDGEQQAGPTQADTESDNDAQALEAMKKKLEEQIRDDPAFQQFRSQLLVDLTPEGLRLQIIDSDNRPMFELASAVVEPHMRTILRALAPVLNSWPNKITLAGHTDSFVYASGDKAYSNWELSADRANASRRELAAGGLAEDRVLRVMGLADSMHLDKANPRDPANRRISIVVLNAATQARMERENSGDGVASKPVSVRVAPAPASKAERAAAGRRPLPDSVAANH